MFMYRTGEQQQNANHSKKVKVKDSGEFRSKLTLNFFDESQVSFEFLIPLILL